MKNYIIFILLIAINLFATETDDRFLVGEYPLQKVVDGDTVKAEGLDASVRILFIDTEEAFKHKTAYEKTKEISENWDDYLASKMINKKNKPIKFNTPNGYQAAVWTKEFFRDVSIIRLEYDNLESKKGFYGRYLAYVFAKKGDKWVNFNLEIIKHGYSPYSTKYGRSIRFHKEFTEAQIFAKTKKIGIWNEKGKHYPDYDERLTWWDKRGEQIDTYRTKHKNEFLFMGGSDYDYHNLKKFIDKDVKLFGLLSGTLEEMDEFTAKMPVKQFVDVYLHYPKRKGYDLKKLKELEDYYVYVTGILKLDQDGKYHVYIKDKSGLTVE